MSGIVKAVKKVFKPVVEKVKSVASATAKVVKKIASSKVFKTVAISAAVYFGGAALLSMAGGGTASAGIGSAWAGAQGAGSALMSGNVSGALSSLGSGFTGGSAAGAAGTFASGQAATAGTIAANSAAPALAGAAAPAVNTSTIGSTVAGYTPEAMSTLSASAPAATNSGGLISSVWNGLGEAGKGAVVSSGINMAGQMLQGSAQQSAMEDAQKRRTYWGVNGSGDSVGNNSSPGLISYVTPQQNNQATPAPTWKTTLDDLINRQQKVVGGYGG